MERLERAHPPSLSRHECDVVLDLLDSIAAFSSLTAGKGE